MFTEYRKVNVIDELFDILTRFWRILYTFSLVANFLRRPKVQQANRTILRTIHTELFFPLKCTF